PALFRKLNGPKFLEKSRYFGSAGASSTEGAGRRSFETASGAGSATVTGDVSAEFSAAGAELSAGVRATSTGGVTAPIRLRIICCRRSSLGVGWAGLSNRGLMIAPARSADGEGASEEADCPK